MNVICKAFLYSIVLLTLCRSGLDFTGLQKQKQQVQYTSVTDWSEESSEEEDDSEFEDEFTTNQSESTLLVFPTPQGFASCYQFDLREHVMEIVPPPPQA